MKVSFETLPNVFQEKFIYIIPLEKKSKMVRIQGNKHLLTGESTNRNKTVW